MFTRSDYRAIASIISKLRKGVGCSVPGDICGSCLTKELGDFFEKDNPRFDWGKWEDATQPAKEEKAA